MLFVVSDHPSLIVSLFPATFWKDLFRHPYYLANVPEVISVMAAVLELSSRKISKKVTASLSRENNVYFIYDFEGVGEFQEFSRLARGSCLPVINSSPLFGRCKINHQKPTAGCLSMDP
jgi:hypothetical protein